MRVAQLKLQSAPILFHVMEKGNPKKCAQYDLDGHARHTDDSHRRPENGVALAGCLRNEHGVNVGEVLSSFLG